MQSNGAWTPQRVVLISRGRYEEGVLAADAYPGMLGIRNSSNAVLPHNAPSGGGAIFVFQEDALRGGDITQKLNSGDAAPMRIPAFGDVLTMLLQNGQSVVEGAGLMSAGDGTLIAAPSQGSQDIYEITVPSAVVTNVGTEATFSNGSYGIPANFLQVGDVLKIHAKAFLIAVNSTNTHRIRAYVGATVLADSTAVALVADDVVIIDIIMTIRTITASGTFIADGQVEYSISGTFTTVPFTIASTTIDTTVVETIKLTTLASATSAGNQIRLDEFRISLDREGGVNVICHAGETINNSAGGGSVPLSAFNSAAFIRAQF